MKGERTIDTLISKLQVYGYLVRINNYCIGDYHNIYIYKYVRVKWLFRELYDLKQVFYGRYRLPTEAKYMINALKNELNKAYKEDRGEH